MKFYPEDYVVDIAVKFIDMNGLAVVPTAISAVLLGDDDAQIVDLGNLPFDAASGETTISVQKQFNNLNPGQIRAARVLVVSIETANGTITRRFSYAIQSSQRLVMMENTFQTLETAEFAAADTPNSSGWSVAQEQQKIAALAEAFRRVTTIPMRFSVYKEGASLSFGGWRSDWNSIAPREVAETVVIERDVWQEVTPEQFAEFPSAFKKALQRAQFVEANEILQGDNVQKKHRQGIASETIGESSVTLRAGAVDYGISSETMKALVGYVYFNNRINRA